MRKILYVLQKKKIFYFAEVVRMMNDGKHLEEDGLEKNKKMVSKMNTRNISIN